MRNFQNCWAVRHLSILLIVTTGVLSLIPPVGASFIQSSASLEAATRHQDLKIISKALETRIVKQRLQDLGYSDQEIQDRLEQLSAREIHNLAVQIDSLTQGGVLGFIIGVLVIVVLILVIFRLA